MAEETATAAQSSEKTKGSGEALDAALKQSNVKEEIAHEVVSEENIGDSRIRYVVKVAAAEVDTRTEEVLKDFSKEVQVPGFRKGKAPKTLVRARFGKPARDEAVRKMVPRLAELVAEAKEVEPLAPPGFDGYKDEDGAASATIILEVRPKVVLTDETLKDISVEITESPVTEDLVEKEITALRERFSTYEAVEGAAFAAQDSISYSVVAETPEGEPLEHLTRENQYDDNISVKFPEVVIEKLTGAKKGDVVKIENVELGDGEPGDRPTVTYTFTINEVKKQVLPELDDEFAKDVSPDFETFAQLRERLETNLKEREEARRRDETLGGIYAELGKRLEFEVPPTLVQRLFNDSINRMEKRYNEMGFSLRQMGKGYVNEIVESTTQRARQDAKTLLIADELARFMNIETSEERMNEEIEKIATLQGRKPLAIRAELEKNKQLDQFKGDLRIRAMEDELISRAKVKVVEKKTEEASDEAESQ